MPLNNSISNSDLIDTAVTTTIELANNTEYRRGTLAALTISLPASLDTRYRSIVCFSSGATATTFTDNTTVKWTGDDVVWATDKYAFVPLINSRYNIAFIYDGTIVIACVLAVGV